MSEYIEREAALKSIKETIIGASEFANDIRIAAMNAVNSTPTADVQEIRHGEWETEITERGMYIRCSECHFDGLVDEDFSYCPNCGTKMDEE